MFVDMHGVGVVERCGKENSARNVVGSLQRNIVFAQATCKADGIEIINVESGFNEILMS